LFSDGHAYILLVGMHHERETATLCAFPTVGQVAPWL
jgi:hypothetical protein